MMKIIIRSKEDRPRRLTLWLPTRALKWRWLCRAIAKDDNVNADPEELRKMFVEAYRFIKKYVREHGHFYLVEAQDGEGDVVKIRI